MDVRFGDIGMDMALLFGWLGCDDEAFIARELRKYPELQVVVGDLGE